MLASFKSTLLELKYADLPFIVCDKLLYPLCPAKSIVSFSKLAIFNPDPAFMSLKSNYSLLSLNSRDLIDLIESFNFSKL